MVVTDVYNHRFHKIFQMDEGLNHIMPKDDIFVWVNWENATCEEYCKMFALVSGSKTQFLSPHKT